MTQVQIISAQIEADKHNIQEMVNLIPLCNTKGETRTLKAVIKVLVKEVHNQKVLIEEKIFGVKPRVDLPLFIVDPSPIEPVEFFSELDSFFGEL